ncbi:MAG: hypothetical protein JO104_04790 [Candidatus Eremiobacteraeota bacterium]|nr:hypothetical protein [Candidatus Eremiobacteraeota bacterium]
MAEEGIAVQRKWPAERGKQDGTIVAFALVIGPKRSEESDARMGQLQLTRELGNALHILSREKVTPSKPRERCTGGAEQRHVECADDREEQGK